MRGRGDGSDRHVDTVDLQAHRIGESGGDVALHGGADGGQGVGPADGDVEMGPDAGGGDVDLGVGKFAAGQLVQSSGMGLHADGVAGGFLGDTLGDLVVDHQLAALTGILR